MQWCVLACVLACVLGSVACLQQRHGSTTYATKTLYSWSHNATEWSIIYNSSTGEPYAPSFCAPVSIDMVYRHGTRNPGDDDIIMMNDLADNIRGHVGNSDFNDLNFWYPPFDLDQESQLILEGEKEHFGLGERLGTRYKSFLSEANVNDFVYQATKKARTAASCRSWQKGLTHSLGVDASGPIIMKNDLLRFYDSCDLYVNDVDENPAATVEVTEFLEGPRMAQLTADLNTRLQLDTDYKITAEQVETIYSTIPLETALNGSSPWKTVFTDEELAVLEYGADIDAYWGKSWGYPINYKQSCPLLTDFFKNMDAAQVAFEKGERYTKGIYRFAHAETVMPLATLIGLFPQKTPLEADNFEQERDRNFHSGEVIPMAANLGMVLYKCDTRSAAETPPPGVSWPDQYESYMIQLLLNEIPINFPNCDFDLCPYGQVKTAYSSYIGCDFNHLCSSADQVFISMGMWVFLLLINVLSRFLKM